MDGDTETGEGKCDDLLAICGSGIDIKNNFVVNY
jgi:hypothetical protein